MATQKGWFIRTREPNTLFWSLRPEAQDSWTTDVDKALLFARQSDATEYFEHHFHPTARDQFQVAGIH